jgi:predicted Fe-Mo cluster-binding NifX family protein
MRICIPVTAYQGMASPICSHFGSAPFFVIVDRADGTCRAIPNRDSHHAHGLCQPLAALRGESIDAIVVGGIGMGALSTLRGAGLQVYRTEQPTVDLTVAALEAGQLREMDPAGACAHHSHGTEGHHARQGRGDERSLMGSRR